MSTEMLRRLGAAAQKQKVVAVVRMQQIDSCLLVNTNIVDQHLLGKLRLFVDGAHEVAADREIK